MSDWLKLHRKSLESQVFSDPATWRIWCWCLLKANWKKGFYGGAEIGPGEFATGRESASSELGISGSAWYRAIKRLQKLRCIELKANNRFTIISIVNWHKYQAESHNKRTTDGQQADSGRTTSEQQADTIEEGKEGLEGKNSLSISSHGKSEKFREYWDKWLTKSAFQNGRPLDEITEQAQLFKLEKYSTDEAIEVVVFCLSLANCKNLLAEGEHKPKPEANGTYRNGRKKLTANDIILPIEDGS